MNTILALDTSTDLLTVSLKQGNCFFTIEKRFGLRHASALLPLVDFAMKETGIGMEEIELIVCTGGPGSFTGLRIGVSTVKGLSLGLDTPFVLIPTLDIYAAKWKEHSLVVAPIVDARKKRIYTALYERGERKTDYLDIPPEELGSITQKYPGILLTGPDAAVIDRKSSAFQIDPFPERGYSGALIQSGLDYYLQHGPSSLSAGPIYLRKSEAEIAMSEKSKPEETPVERNPGTP